MSCVDALGLSELQRTPVLDERSPLLVAAGAGSGKTRLLVAYFVRALIEEGLQPEQLVAVTFTRKAASELVSRIRAALEQQGRPDLARSLDKATVGTIHSLCRRLVRQRYLETGTDPAAAILEAEAASLVKEKISREAWEAVTERAEREQLAVLASAGGRLRKQLVPLYDRLRGLGQERPQVVVEVTSVRGESFDAATRVESAADELIAAIRAALTAAAESPRMTATLRKDLESLERCLAWLGRPYSCEQRASDIDDTLAFFPSRRTASMEPFFEPVRTALTGYREMLAELRLRPLVDAANLLLAEFHLAYETHKRERGLLDFADLELAARRLVARSSQEPSILPTGSRLLVDEFQDTNSLQYSIIDGLGASRLLMVGDERQSIYRFRGADVRVFGERVRDLARPRAGEERGRVHRLDVNYRSRPEILAFVNHLFRHESFFGEQFAVLRTPETVADDGAPVDSTPRHERQASGNLAAPSAVEIMVVERWCDSEDVSVVGSAHDAEAEAIAERVRRLIDDEGWSQRHITILVPAQTHVSFYENALVSRGVDVYVVGGKGYYSQEEVSDVKALLRLLLNPHDDLALVAVLRSPLVGISDDGLYLLGRESRKTRTSLWHVACERGMVALRGPDVPRLELFVRRLRGLRRRVGRPGLARLIDDAISTCDYDLCLLGLAQGRRRFANVRKLMRMATEFESVEGPDLAGFVELLESMGELSDREGSAPTLAEGEDVVRIMTVHQAKGLEFPVVVLAGLGSEVRTTDAAEFMVADDGTAGAFLRGSRHDRYEDHDLSWGPATAILGRERASEREEDLRLLYVAMTRAEQRLILVGAKPRTGGIEKCRIGRVLSALGYESFPEAGELALLPEIDATVWAAMPRPPEHSACRPTGVERRAGGEIVATGTAGQLPECPQFLQIGLRDHVPRRISFSALAAFQRCPRRYYLERVLGLGYDVEDALPRGILADPDDPADQDEPSMGEILVDEEERLSGQDIGLAVHALLERLPRGEGRPSQAHMQRLIDAWSLEAGPRLSDAEVERVLALASAFWDSPVADLRDLAGAELEAPFLFAHGGTVFNGVMDLLHRTDDGWRIVDYKTNALNGRTPAEAAMSYRLQATTYCLAALRSGARAVRMDFIFLEAPATPVVFEYTSEATTELGESLDEVLLAIGQGRFERCEGEQCATCSVQEVCTAMASALPDGIQ